MKKIKTMFMILSLSVIYQFASAQSSCSSGTVRMSKGPKTGCGCHCQKKCVLFSDTLTYKNAGWHYGNCWGSCCWIRTSNGVSNEEAASETTLNEIYPNPVSGSVTISFTLAEQSQVTIQVLDITGRYVATVTNDIFEDESSEVNWDASGLNTGIYFLQLKAGSYSVTKKINVVH